MTTPGPNLPQPDLVDNTEVVKLMHMSGYTDEWHLPMANKVKEVLRAHEGRGINIRKIMEHLGLERFGLATETRVFRTRMKYLGLPGGPLHGWWREEPTTERAKFARVTWYAPKEEPAWTPPPPRVKKKVEDDDEWTIHPDAETEE